MYGSATDNDDDDDNDGGAALRFAGRVEVQIIACVLPPFIVYYDMRFDTQ